MSRRMSQTSTRVEMHTVWLFAVVWLLVFAFCVTAKNYEEQLYLKALSNDHLLATFNFKGNTTSDKFHAQHFRLFPRALGQILRYARAEELHIRFTSGQWDDERWGARAWSGMKEGGTGVEVWAWIEADTDDLADYRWSLLANALSGLFCSSINFVDSTRTVRPVLTFNRESVYKQDSDTVKRLKLIHGSLPHETFCTENLTPFLKLLPCKGQVGISSLLHGHILFASSWQSMSVDIRSYCEMSDADCIIQINQSVNMVINVEWFKRSQRHPIPHPIPIDMLKCDTSKSFYGPDACFPVEKNYQVDFLLSEIFDNKLIGACVPDNTNDERVASVCIDGPKDRNIVTIGDSTFEQTWENNGTMKCYNLREDTTFDLFFPSHHMSNISPMCVPPLHATRVIAGYGAERGSVKTELKNTSVNETLKVVYMEALPWFMRTYIHTLKVYLTNEHNATKRITQPLEMYYRPAADRQHGSHLEMVLEIPAGNWLTLSYDFGKALLRCTEYPPDANRGFDAASAIIRVLQGERSSYVRTSNLLLSLPTPDFSMPYNVIILTSTVIALGFGGLFNLLVREFVDADKIGNARMKTIYRMIIAAKTLLQPTSKGKEFKVD